MNFSRYIIKRLLYFIPTLGLLFLLVFGLQQSMPGDKVADLLRSGDFQSNQNTFEQRKTYNRLASELGVGLPVFYFSLGPRNQLKFQTTGDVRLDQVKKTWLKNHKKEAVDIYFDRLMRMTHEVKGLTISTEGKDRLYGILFLIGQRNPHQTIPYWEDLEDHWPNKGGTSDLIHDREYAISTSIDFASSIPSFRWNGMKNRFHKEVKSLLLMDWGKSKVDGRQVKSKVGLALIWTLTITILGLLTALFFAFLLGLWSSLKDNTLVEKSISALLFALFSMPTFWLATIFIIFFTTADYGKWTDIFPSVGIFILDDASVLEGLWRKRQLLILPVLCLSLPTIAYFYRFILTGQRSESRKVYFTTALAKGMTRSQALVKHTFRNASYPILGLSAVILPGLISGALVIEVIFNLPGMGRLMFQSVQTQDWNVVTAVVFISAFLSFIGFLVADLLLPKLDPKVKIDV